MSLVSDTVAEYTCCPGPAVSRPPRDAEDIVLVPWGGDLAAGFACARSLLDQGRAVRLIGNGVTLPQVWPEWLSQSSRLLLTELGAYRGGPEHPQRILPLRADMEDWLDSLFAGALDDFPAGKVFFGSAALRIFRQFVEAYPSVRNLVECHPGARYHCTDPTWLGLSLLRHLTGEDAPSRGRLSWFLRMWFWGIAALAATELQQLQRYRAEARSRQRLRALRQAASSPASAPVWAVLSPDWMRINRHLLDSLVAPRLKRGAPTGVLLFAHLRAGARQEHDMRPQGQELWPALGPLRDALDRSPLDQITSVESLRALLKLLARTGWRGLRVIARAAAQPPQVRRGAFHFDLSTHALALAKLATHDLCETLAAGEATRAAIARCDFRSATVVFPASNLAPHVLPDLMLQRAGARTLEYEHGSVGAAWLALTPTCSSLRAVWTRADETALAPFGQPIIVAGMLRKLAQQVPPARRPPRNLLLATSYVHRDVRLPTGYPLEIFQDEFLRVVPVVKECCGERFAFRWRPHPADDEGRVRAALARYPGVELSRGRPLEDDVAWADILVSNLSSVVAESLPCGKAIFVHVLPFYRLAPEVACVDPARRFFRADELRKSFPACVAALDRQDPAALEPERRMQVALFGSAELPISVDEWLEQEATLASSLQSAGTA